MDDKIPYQSDSKMECKFEISRKDLRKIYFSASAEHSSVNGALMPQSRQEMGLGGGAGGGSTINMVRYCVE